MRRSDPDEPLRVLIVDDHKMFAESLAMAVSQDPEIEAVGIAHDGGSAIDAARSLRPDVVLMDQRLPDGDGTDFAAKIKDEHPQTTIVMVTAADAASVLLAAIEAGCSGFITKDGAVKEVVDAVKAAHAGEMLIPPAVLSRLLPQLRRSEAPSSVDLTNREMDVLMLLGKGMSNHQIAASLSISLNTARNHIQSVLAKMGAHSKLEAVTKAVRNGLIALE